MKQVSSDSFLKIPLEEVENKEFDFCMCNPPFFVNEFEASHGIARSEKRPQPSGVCTGTETETVTGGGEVEFVKEIIKDSLTMKEKIRYNHFFFFFFIVTVFRTLLCNKHKTSKTSSWFICTPPSCVPPSIQLLFSSTLFLSYKLRRICGLTLGARGYFCLYHCSSMEPAVGSEFPMPSFVHSFNTSWVHELIHSFVRSFFYLFIRLFISCIIV